MQTFPYVTIAPSKHQDNKPFLLHTFDPPAPTSTPTPTSAPTSSTPQPPGIHCFENQSTLTDLQFTVGKDDSSGYGMPGILPVGGNTFNPKVKNDLSGKIIVICKS